MKFYDNCRLVCRKLSEGTHCSTLEFEFYVPFFHHRYIRNKFDFINIGVDYLTALWILYIEINFRDVTFISFGRVQMISIKQEGLFQPKWKKNKCCSRLVFWWVSEWKGDETKNGKLWKLILIWHLLRAKFISPMRQYIMNPSLW